MAIMQNGSGQEGYAFVDGQTGKYMASGSSGIRAKTMAPSVGMQMLPPGQVVASQQHML